MKPKSAHGIELGFGINAYTSIGMAGFFALLPFTAGVASIIGWLGGFDPGAGSSSSAVNEVVGGLAAFSIVVAPWLIPCLVLRARQPKGARIDWTSDEVAEWDGPWKRTAIRWENAEAAKMTWHAAGHTSRLRMVIQIRDKTNPSSVITTWEEEPEEMPIVRRRFEASKLHALDSAIEMHVQYTGRVELELIVDPDRVAQRKAVRWLTRLGYVGAFSGPLAAGENPPLGLALSAAGALLLAWRAAPAFRELFRVTRRLYAAPAPMPAYADPYRAAASARVERDPNELQALRYRLRAVVAEACVRAMFVVLPIAGAVAAMFTRPR